MQLNPEIEVELIFDDKEELDLSIVKQTLEYL